MEAAAAAAPVEASQEPPEQEAAPVSAPNDASTPALPQRTVAASVSAPNDAGTPTPAERTAQVQGKAPGPRVAQQETPGPRAAGPEAVPVCRKNLQEKDRQVTVAEPPGQSKTGTPVQGQERVWRRWSRGNPTRQRRHVVRSGRGER